MKISGLAVYRTVVSLRCSPRSEHNRHFTTGPVVGFVINDIESGAAELRRAGAEVFGPYRAEDGGAWVHFRAPDGRIYELTQQA